MIGCEDFNDFSTNPAYRLRFSQDTLSLDTILTEIPTSTHKLMVYNPQEENLRISSIRLSSNGSSGYRINVDGIAGNNFQNIYLAGKDSMYIFVEATLPYQHTPNVRLLKDSILFSVNNNQQAIILQAFAQDAVIMRGETISKDTTIQEERPILIYDSLCIAPNTRLTLSAGSKLYFHHQAYLSVRGQLNVAGTMDNPVLFRGDRTDRLFSYLPYDRLPGQWGGIILERESSGNVIQHADIHGGEFGIRCIGNNHEDIQLTLEHSVITQVNLNGLACINSKAVIGNCEISNAGQHAVFLQGGDYAFTHCTLANHFSWNIRKGYALFFTNTSDEDTAHPLQKADFRNCLISGSFSDELYAVQHKDESIAFNYYFSHSLLHTIESGSEAFINNKWQQEEHFKNIDDKHQLFDFSLTSSSAAIDCGLNDDAQYYPTDRKGVSRLEDDAPDAGCYEFQTNVK